MTHYRNKILTKLVNILKDKTEVKTKVYSNRLQPIVEEELPALILYINNEEATRETMTRPCLLKKELDLSIEIFVGTSNTNELLNNTNNKLLNTNILTLDEQINNIAGQIEILLADNYNLNALVLDTKYTNFEMILNNDSSSPKGIAKMSYLITYRSLDNEPFLNI